MEESVSAADANRKFSYLLRGVREGRTYVVTSHGKPVAKIVPADGQKASSVGLQTLLARLAKKPIVQISRWTRDELYDDDL